VRSTWIENASRLVVKVGTGVLTNSRNQPDLAQLEQLVAQLAAQRKTGREVVLVTSGAVGAGMGALGYSSRPATLPEKQACAAVGQSRLMAAYDELFARHGLVVAQVLLTHADLEDHERHLDARNTLCTLLAKGIVPIINENDAVSFTEIKFGDNDTLSALVATLLPADLLIILTTVDGLIENYGRPDAKLIPEVVKIDARLEELSGNTLSATAVGGMISKLEAAKVVMRSGIPLVIAPGRRADSLERVMNSDEIGTLFVPNARKLRGRKRWIAFFHRPRGTLVVDEGARRALRDGGKSLLPPGVKSCDGEFAAGEVVRVCDSNGTEFARGIARFSANEVRAGRLARVELVHRDDLVIL
jgi:glutamate 5-kinase